ERAAAGASPPGRCAGWRSGSHRPAWQTTPAQDRSRSPARGGQRPNRHTRTGEAGVPAVRLTADRHRLGCALQRTRPADGDPADLGQDQEAIVERGTVAELLVGETGVAMHTLKAGIAWRLARLDAAEEGLECPIQAGEHVLQDLRVHVAVLRAHLL